MILYIMLCGYPPFYSETPSRQITMEMRRKILSGEFEFPEDEWCHVSNEAKDLVRRYVRFVARKSVIGVSNQVRRA